MMSWLALPISLLVGIASYLLLQGTVLKKPSLLKLVPNSTYDYIIVGAGSAGCVLANRLSEDTDSTVLLVEAGGDDRDNWRINVPGYATYLWNSSSSKKYYTEPIADKMQGFKNGRSFWPRGHVLGGSSSINAMMYVRGSPNDFNRWAKYTGDDSWDYRHVLPYFKKSEGAIDDNLRKSSYHNTNGPLPVSRAQDPPSIASKLIEAFQELGYPFNEDYNGVTREGISYSQYNIKDGERWSSARAFLHPVLTRSNLDVVIHADVERVLIENKKAKGITLEVEGKQMKILAKKEVILSAGSLGSPHILMLSGIGPAQHLKEMDIPLEMDLPVGQNLQDHLMFGVTYSIEEPISNTLIGFTAVYNFMLSSIKYFLYKTGMLSSSGLDVVLFSSTTPQSRKLDWPDVELLFMMNSESNDAMETFAYDRSLINELAKERDNAIFGWICFPNLLRPESKGNLTLRSKNILDNVIIQANYLDQDIDLQIFLQGVELCRKASSTKAMQTIGNKLGDSRPPESCKEHEMDSTDYWACMIKLLPSTVFHPVGTCKMGPADDNSSVVDSKLRVKGISNLRVVDGSIMPYITSGNTHAPIVMIAEKAADMIMGR